MNPFFALEKKPNFIWDNYINEWLRNVKLAVITFILVVWYHVIIYLEKIVKQFIINMAIQVEYYEEEETKNNIKDDIAHFSPVLIGNVFFLRIPSPKLHLARLYCHWNNPDEKLVNVTPST